MKIRRVKLRKNEFLIEMYNRMCRNHPLSNTVRPSPIHRNVALSSITSQTFVIVTAEENGHFSTLNVFVP